MVALSVRACVCPSSLVVARENAPKEAGSQAGLPAAAAGERGRGGRPVRGSGPTGGQESQEHGKEKSTASVCVCVHVKSISMRVGSCTLQ